MDEDGIGLVLARASELRSKITNCIQNSSSIVISDGTNQETGSEDKQKDEEEEEEDESLLNIRDALESLEAQLSSLQSLQQQQWYEKEASLAEIDYSRKKLLQKLKGYKGDHDLDVIHEAISFASSTVEIENNDLLLPPYPSHPSHLPFTHKISQNGVTTSSHLKGKIDQSEPKDSIKTWKQVMGAAKKTILTLVGFIVVLSLSGFEPRVGKRGGEFKILGVEGEHKASEDKKAIGCPPGKVLVVENGEIRCLIKERVEIPFTSVSTTPDVHYGCG